MMSVDLQSCFFPNAAPEAEQKSHPGHLNLFKDQCHEGQQQASKDSDQDALGQWIVEINAHCLFDLLASMLLMLRSGFLAFPATLLS